MAPIEPQRPRQRKPLVRLALARHPPQRLRPVSPVEGRARCATTRNCKPSSWPIGWRWRCSSTPPASHAQRSSASRRNCAGARSRCRRTSSRGVRVTPRPTTSTSWTSRMRRAARSTTSSRWPSAWAICRSRPLASCLPGAPRPARFLRACCERCAPRSPRSDLQPTAYSLRPARSADLGTPLNWGHSRRQGRTLDWGSPSNRTRSAMAGSLAGDRGLAAFRAPAAGSAALPGADGQR